MKPAYDQRVDVPGLVVHAGLGGVGRAGEPDVRRHAEHPEAADVLVNCTSVGLDPKTTVPEALRALDLAGHDPPATVVDLVYGAGPTPLTQWARRAGARVVEGLEVLASQGARSLEGWTGRPSPIDLMRRAAQDR